MRNAIKPAYPVPNTDEVVYTGLTKREVFAIAAMQGLLANPAITNHEEGFPLCSKVIGYTDELLKQLES